MCVALQRNPCWSAALADRIGGRVVRPGVWCAVSAWHSVCVCCVVLWRASSRLPVWVNPPGGAPHLQLGVRGCRRSAAFSIDIGCLRCRSARARWRAALLLQVRSASCSTCPALPWSLRTSIAALLRPLFSAPPPSWLSATLLQHLLLCWHAPARQGMRATWCPAKGAVGASCSVWSHTLPVGYVSPVRVAIGQTRARQGMCAGCCPAAVPVMPASLPPTFRLARLACVNHPSKKANKHSNNLTCTQLGGPQAARVQPLWPWRIRPWHLRALMGAQAKPRMRTTSPT